MSFADKLRDEGPYVFPHVRGAILDAFDRAGVADVSELDAIECHDCFTTTHYMAIDHFGITAPGESWKAIEDGTRPRRRSVADQPERWAHRVWSSGRCFGGADAARRRRSR